RTAGTRGGSLRADSSNAWGRYALRTGLNASATPGLRYQATAPPRTCTVSGMKHAREQHGPAASLNRTAFAATWHCLTGCAIGEILGLVIAPRPRLEQRPLDRDRRRARVLLRLCPDAASPDRGGVPFRQAARVALAADTASIAVMEIVDNAFI